MHGRPQRDPPRRARAVRGHPAGLRGRPLPLAHRRRGAGDPARDGVDARRRRHGARAPRRDRCGASSSTPSRSATEHGGALLRNFRDLTPRADAGRHARRGPPAHPRPAPRVHHRTLATWCDPEAVFVSLFGDREHAVWLDSARAEPGLARFSFMGAPDGPLGQVVRYDVATRALTVDRAGKTRGAARERARLLQARARPVCGPTPRSCRSTSSCGFAGYLGYELKAECGGDARAPLAAARRRARVLRPADRVRPRRAPRPPARAGRSDARRRRRGMAGDHRAPARGPCASRRRPRRLVAGALSFAAREGRDAYLANIAACLHEIVEGETYEVCLTTELHSDGTIDPARRLSRPARAQPRAARGAAAPGRRLGAQLLARALPARRPRADRRVEADQGHRRARRPPRRGRVPRRRAARRRQVARREPHDRRPRAQRPRPRVRAGQRRGAEAHGHRVLRHRPPARHDGPGPPARRRVRDRLHPRGVSGRLDDRRAEAAHDGDHRPARDAARAACTRARWGSCRSTGPPISAS